MIKEVYQHYSVDILLRLPNPALSHDIRSRGLQFASEYYTNIYSKVLPLYLKVFINELNNLYIENLNLKQPN